jgi:hypothetical protein
LVNADAPDDWALYRAERRVLEIQTKLHRWAIEDPHRRFDDLFNLVTDPAFLLVAWDRVRSNKGARTAGADGKTVSYIENRFGVEVFLARLRSQLKDRSFRPVEAGVGTHLGGGLSAVLLRVSPKSTRSRRDRRDTHARLPHL